MGWRTDVSTTARCVILGYLAGTVGTAAMTATTAWQKHVRTTDDIPVDYDATRHVVQAAGTALRHEPTTDAGATALFQLTHWGYGSAMAIGHRLLVRRLGQPRAAIIFFGGVQTMAFVLFPALGDTPPPWRWRRDVLASSVAHHVVYVIAVAAADRTLDSIWAGDVQARSARVTGLRHGVPRRSPREPRGAGGASTTGQSGRLTPTRWFQVAWR